MLHLAGYDLPLDEIKRYRQLGSKTPGHPEHGATVGVGTTPARSAGFGNAVGMALGARVLAARVQGGSFQPITSRVGSRATAT
jgi:transketolase